MQLFVDTANREDVEKALTYGCITGITTNPTIISRENKPLEQCVEAIIKLDPSLTILLEGVSTELDSLVAEGRKLASYSEHAVVKVPATPVGLAACRRLAEASIPVCVTLVFSVNQAIMAACAGAAWVAPFIGRLDDNGTDGIRRIGEIRRVFSQQNVTCKIIAASIRNAVSVAKAFEAGADAVTLPAKLLEPLLHHELTTQGLAKFEADWQNVPNGDPGSQG